MLIFINIYIKMCRNLAFSRWLLLSAGEVSLSLVPFTILLRWKKHAVVSTTRTGVLYYEQYANYLAFTIFALFFAST